MHKEHNPNPLNTSNIHLSDELLELTEILAENTHEIWAKQRLKDGWKYGKERNDKQKEHPCLIPYEELAESEKEYDRTIALEILKVIKKLGFKIEK